jgi:hypothetical protein
VWAINCPGYVGGLARDVGEKKISVNFKVSVK